jgi:hypothetical protein
MKIGLFPENAASQKKPHLPVNLTEMGLALKTANMKKREPCHQDSLSKKLLGDTVLNPWAHW